MNQKRQSAFANDEAIQGIPTIATAVVIKADNPIGPFKPDQTERDGSLALSLFLPDRPNEALL